MAQERALTPEKQLLNLIESPRSKDAVIQSRIVKYHSMGFFSPGAWKGKLLFFRDNLKKSLSGESRQIDIKFLNRLLAVAIMIAVFYLVSTFYFSVTGLNNMKNRKFIVKDGVKQSGEDKEVLSLKQTVSHYLDRIRQRDIFKMGPKKVSNDAVPAAPNSKIVEATQNLKLVGISWSKDPDAMIEDTRALKTFFVKRGQMIGQVRVEAIFKDKVILKYDTEEIELR